MHNKNEKFDTEKSGHSWPNSDQESDEENWISAQEEIEEEPEVDYQNVKSLQKNDEDTPVLSSSLYNNRIFINEARNCDFSIKWDSKGEEDCNEECDETHASSINNCAQLVRIFPPHSNTSMMKFPSHRHRSEDRVEESKKAIMKNSPGKKKRTLKPKLRLDKNKSQYCNYEDLLPQYDCEFQTSSFQKPTLNLNELSTHMNKVYNKIAKEQKLNLLRTSPLHNELSKIGRQTYYPRKASDIDLSAYRSAFDLSARIPPTLKIPCSMRKPKSNAELLQKMIAVMDRLGNFVLPLAEYYRDPDTTPHVIDFLQAISHRKRQESYSEAMQQIVKLLNSELPLTLGRLNSTEPLYFEEFYPESYVRDYIRIEEFSLNIAQNWNFNFGLGQFQVPPK